MMGYGQTEIQHDLYDALDAAGNPPVFDVDDVTLHGIDTDRPAVTLLAQAAPPSASSATSSPAATATTV